MIIRCFQLQRSIKSSLKVYNCHNCFAPNPILITIWLYISIDKEITSFNLYLLLFTVSFLQGFALKRNHAGKSHALHYCFTTTESNSELCLPCCLQIFNRWSKYTRKYRKPLKYRHRFLYMHKSVGTSALEADICLQIKRCLQPEKHIPDKNLSNKKKRFNYTQN